MTANRDNLEAWLEQAQHGDLDALTPEQIAALEAALNASPALSEQIADAVPSTGRLFSDTPSPTQVEWDGVWAKVEAGAAATATPPFRVHMGSARDEMSEARVANRRRDVRPRVIRFWTSISAAAACIALALVWRGLLTSQTVAPAPELWTMSPAANTDILELEVYDDAVAAVDFGDGASGAVVISVYEKPRSSEGA